MSSTISASPRFRKPFAENSGNTNRLRPRRYAPRHEDLSEYMPARVQITYLAFRATMNPATRTSIAGIRDIALKTGRDVKTVRIHAQLLDKLGVMPSEKRSKFTITGKRVNLTKRYYFPQLDEDFLASKREGGTPETGRGSTLADLEQTTTTTTAPQGGVYVDYSERDQPEAPKRPTPDPEVWQAEQEALRQRRAKQHEKRQAHYARAKAMPRLEGRSRRHHEAPTPIQEAAGEVLQLNGVAVPCDRLRRATEAAVELYSRREWLRPKLCVERMVLAWAAYQRDNDVLIGAVGMERFYGEGVWCNPKGWRYDHEALARARRF
jgi:hypothetical protein